jgi:hypothetical protein
MACNTSALRWDASAKALRRAAKPVAAFDRLAREDFRAERERNEQYRAD